MLLPRVAYKAALLANRYPDASANLIRALLGLSAEVPTETLQRLQPTPRELHQALSSASVLATAFQILRKPWRRMTIELCCWRIGRN